MVSKRTTSTGLLPLARLPKWIYLVYLLMSVRQCVILNAMPSGRPGCDFPAFLQSADPGYGDWTWKYGGDTHVGKVKGGQYTICSKQYSKERSGESEETCLDSQKLRMCHRQHGSLRSNLFVVQHVEDRPIFQCIRFIVRSSTVIQLELSDISENATGICDRPMTLDHSPWISVKHYTQAVVNCPFTGGYNFHEIHEYTKDHVLQRGHCRKSQPHDLEPPVRVESDCVDKEGIILHFRDKNCVPSRSYFSLTQKLVCMASWEKDGDGFALLRKDQRELAFYCIRVSFKHLEVTQIVIYLDWECYRATDLSAPGGHLRLGYSTPYIIFRHAQKRVISAPCRSNLVTCGSIPRDPQTEHQLHPCQHCLNTTGYTCDFDDVVINTWTIREPHDTHLNLTIHKKSLHHPSLGLLQCVTFDPNQRVALRAILWGVYENGCYPRFTCMYYDTPASNIIRYRFSNVQLWPKVLSDDGICSEENFVTRPDFYDPQDRYEERPWNIALSTAGQYRRMACVYPSEIPNQASFIDNNNYTGCITFRSRSSHKHITMQYVGRLYDPETQVYSYLKHSSQHHFQCLAAVTYISGYKTVITLTQGRENESLCWMIIDPRTLVVVSTSSCNQQTALGILRGEERYFSHLKWQLSLNAAGDDIANECSSMYRENEEQWEARIAAQVESRAAKNESGSGSRGSYGDFPRSCFCSVWLAVTLSGVVFSFATSVNFL